VTASLMFHVYLPYFLQLIADEYLEDILKSLLVL
jgi:hypothetical protein